MVVFGLGFWGLGLRLSFWGWGFHFKLMWFWACGVGSSGFFGLGRSINIDKRINLGKKNDAQSRGSNS